MSKNEEPIHQPDKDRIEKSIQEDKTFSKGEKVVNKGENLNEGYKPIKDVTSPPPTDIASAGVPPKDEK